MTSTVETSLGHPVLTFASQLHGSLDSLADVPCWSATADEQRSTLIGLHQARARLDELWLRMLAAGDRNDIAADSAATSTGAWLAAHTRRAPGAAQADVKLATALDSTCGTTREALARGDLDLEQARVVVAAVQAIPQDALTEDATCATRAEDTLVDLARTHDARRLKQLGRHILHVLDPEAADLRLGRRLEQEERAAARSAFLELHDNDDGTHTGRFKIPTFHAAALKKMLDAIANPARRATGTAPAETPAADPAADAGADSPRRTRPELRGQAFCELLERLRADHVPTSGGVNATVVVHVDLDVLLTGLGTARLDTGEQISAGMARRLACEAGIIPAVVRKMMDGRSVVLDMGRKRRLHTEHMRIALGIEQGGCTAEHCDRPAGWCDAHHDVPWSQLGATSVANGRLLCPFHHHKAHSSSYRMERLDRGTIRFHRRS